MEKICIICGRDCSTEPRFKNDEGQYLHEACYQREQENAAPKLSAAPPPSVPSSASKPTRGFQSPLTKAPVRKKPHGGSGQLVSLFFSFDGRLSRSQYWLFGLSLFGFQVILGVLGGMTEWSIFFLLSLVAVWPGLVLNVKRFHDRDKSGWWLLLLLIPIIGALWVFFELGFLRGTAGFNQYGDDPV